MKKGEGVVTTTTLVHCPCDIMGSGTVWLAAAGDTYRHFNSIELTHWSLIVAPHSDIAADIV